MQVVTVPQRPNYLLWIDATSQAQVLYKQERVSRPYNDHSGAQQEAQYHPVHRTN